jgi:hypothetical protein
MSFFFLWAYCNANAQSIYDEMDGLIGKRTYFWKDMDDAVNDERADEKREWWELDDMDCEQPHD